VFHTYYEDFDRLLNFMHNT